jgi:hypothetical protein
VEGVPASASSAADCVRELRCQPLRARMDAVQKALQSASGDGLNALLTEKNDLRRRIAEL